jgi:AraC-like DNA-binding protein
VKGDFREDLRSAKRDLIDAQHQGFDWEQLYERLSEDVADADSYQRLAEAVTRLLQMLLPLAHRQIRPEVIGLRLIALAWVLNPGYFAGAPSLRQLARRCGVKPSALARYTGQSSRFIRWRNRGQRHAWNWSQVERSDDK